MADPSKRTVETVWAREQGRCARCMVALTLSERGSPWGWAVHHRRPRAIGGSSLAWVNLPANLVAICAPCHTHIESHREQSRLTGFLVPLNGRLRADEVPIEHKLHGLVLLTDDGLWTPTIAAIALELAVHNGRKEG